MTKPDEQLALIRDHFDAIAKWCPAKPEWSTPGPTRSEDQLSAFEREHGITIPAGYRRFLLEVGDGGAGLEWHGSCDCGRLRAIGEWSLERSCEPFPIDDDEWFEESHLDDGVEPTDGTVQLGHTTDHANLHLVLSGERAGEVWEDCTGSDGPFRKVADDFLGHSAAMLDRIVQAHRRGRSPEENRAEADALTPMRRVKFYAESSKHVSGLFADDRPLGEVLGGLVDAVEPAKRSTATGMIARVISNIIADQIINQRQTGTEPLDADLMRELARIWKLHLGNIAGTDEWRLFGPYGWVQKHVAYPATMLGFAELWDEMLEEARFALSHEGIHSPANHHTHAHIALAALDREPDPAFDFADPKINVWEYWHLSQLLARLAPEARERLRARIPATIYDYLVR